MNDWTFVGPANVRLDSWTVLLKQLEGWLTTALMIGRPVFGIPWRSVHMLCYVLTRSLGSSQLISTTFTLLRSILVHWVFVFVHW